MKFLNIKHINLKKFFISIKNINIKNINKKNKTNIFFILSGGLILFYWLADSVTTALYLCKFNIKVIIPILEISLSNFFLILAMIIILKGAATFAILLITASINTPEITDKVFKGHLPPILKNTVLETTSFSVISAFILFGILATLFNIALLTGNYITPDDFDIVSNVLYLAVIGMVYDMMFTFKQEKSQAGSKQ